MVPVEAMASGRPVVAFGRGGATETVIHGRTGYLFEEQTVEALVDAVEAIDRVDLDPAEIVATARAFGPDRFARGMKRFVDDAIAASAIRLRRDATRTAPTSDLWTEHPPVAGPIRPDRPHPQAPRREVTRA
jgi:glycosyltransferase involved in cell wall biosynthesis